MPALGASALRPDITGYHVRYSFKGAPMDGVAPWSKVVVYNGVLYGTTNGGGTNEGGVAYALTAAGKETVLHNFGNGTDGGDGNGPAGDLIAYGNQFFGVTTYGGHHGGGIAFGINPAGTETFTHSFYANGTSTSDGAQPDSGVVRTTAFYGTTSGGGAFGQGTVYVFTLAGKERILHSFAGGADGGTPQGGLVLYNGLYYGTTYTGGSAQLGTVFTISPTGTHRVLYSFKSTSDGTYPQTALVPYQGLLYGTTWQGGANQKGTVFSISPAGKERVLHSFGAGVDGAYPQSGLTLHNGAFYGTTYTGGSGGGTVFAVTPSGGESVVHPFNGSVPGEGYYPRAGLTSYNGTLYGTTANGGAYGGGTVFSFAP